ncbi:MAG: extracellular solute-binding protein, partial [Spirochaetaceae bacterium]|nr:extracellular solute-binding protein [Spirochaetaceae bacterium]
MKRKVIIAMCLLIAMSAWAAGGKVVVYTAHEETIINALVPLFEKETGIKVEYVKLGSGDVIKRAKAEASKPYADVIWSIGGEQLEAESAILAPYTPKDWDKINPVYKVGTNWLPYTGIMNVFIVNTKMLTP